MAKKTQAHISTEGKKNNQEVHQNSNRIIFLIIRTIGYLFMYFWFFKLSCICQFFFIISMYCYLIRKKLFKKNEDVCWSSASSARHALSRTSKMLVESEWTLKKEILYVQGSAIRWCCSKETDRKTRLIKHATTLGPGCSFQVDVKKNFDP